MRSEDILARADQALGRIGRSHRSQTVAKPFVSRPVQWALVAGGLALLWMLIMSPFRLAMLVLVGLGLFALTRSGKRAAPKAVANDLPKADLASLPLKSELWLASQRRLLPAAAQSMTDSISTRLKTLASQIDTVKASDLIAHDIRRLLSEELPDLINDYHRVPAAMRKAAANGLVPDQQLAQGLIIIDARLEQINLLLAAAPVSALATQARYLDLKYQGSDT